MRKAAILWTFISRICTFLAQKYGFGLPSSASEAEITRGYCCDGGETIEVMSMYDCQFLYVSGPLIRYIAQQIQAGGELKRQGLGACLQPFLPANPAVRPQYL